MCFYNISTVTVLILFQSAAILFFKFGSLWVSLELVGKVWWHQIGKQRWLLLVGLPERGESDGFRGLKTHSHWNQEQTLLMKLHGVLRQECLKDVFFKISTYSLLPVTKKIYWAAWKKIIYIYTLHFKSLRGPLVIF